MSDEPRDWRMLIRQELELLSSAKDQMEYEANVPHVDITSELLCGWFDDHYYPDDDEFKSWFTDNELEALSTFNDFFDERITLLPESKGTVQNWLKSPAWREVMAQAQKTLNLIPA